MYIGLGGLALIVLAAVFWQEILATVLLVLASPLAAIGWFADRRAARERETAPEEAKKPPEPKPKFDDYFRVG